MIVIVKKKVLWVQIDEWIEFDELILVGALPCFSTFFLVAVCHLSLWGERIQCGQRQGGIQVRNHPLLWGKPHAESNLFLAFYKMLVTFVGGSPCLQSLFPCCWATAGCIDQEATQWNRLGCTKIFLSSWKFHTSPNDSTPLSRWKTKSNKICGAKMVPNNL